MPNTQDSFSITKWNYHAFDGLGTEFRGNLKPMQTTYEVSCFGELINVLRTIRNVYVKYNNPVMESLWYRGQSSSKYKLFPTLLREYYKNYCQSSLPDYQRKLLEYFLMATRNSPELGAAYKYGNMQIENLSEMQHYRLPTSLLDWSEDPMVGLYFACFKKDDAITPNEAAVFVLNPYLYNLARGELIRYFIGNIRVVENNSIQMDSYLTAPYLSGNMIPNFRAAYNLTAKHFNNYIFGPGHYFSLRDTNCHHDSNPLENPSQYRDSKSPLFPLAILIPKGNPHMLAQSGTFVAFNLCEMPIKKRSPLDEELDLYPHINLEKVQEFYFSNVFQNYVSGALEQQLERTPCGKAIMDATPFLFKIVIKKEAVKECAEQVKIMGKRWDTIYPDLINIGDHLANFVKV